MFQYEIRRIMFLWWYSIIKKTNNIYNFLSIITDNDIKMNEAVQ